MNTSSNINNLNSTSLSTIKSALVAQASTSLIDQLKTYLQQKEMQNEYYVVINLPNNNGNTQSVHLDIRIMNGFLKNTQYIELRETQLTAYNPCQDSIADICIPIDDTPVTQTRIQRVTGLTGLAAYVLNIARKNKNTQHIEPDQFYNRAWVNTIMSAIIAQLIKPAHP